MNNAKHIILFWAILITACGPAPAATTAPATETVLPTRQVTSTQMNTPTFTPSPTMTVTMTPLPTFSAIDAENELLDVLRDNGGCSFPCFWGFFPGKAKMDSYASFLTRFDEISPSIEIILKRSDSLLGVYATAQGGYKGEPEIVKWFDVDLRAYQKKEFEEKMVYGNQYYTEYFQYYSLQNLLSTYGPPEQAYIVLDTGIADMGLGVDLYLLSIEYPKQSWITVFEMPLVQKGTSLMGCPSDAMVHLRLWSPAEKPPPGAIFGGFGGNDKSYLFTIEEATGMTVEEFYQKFKDPENTNCLETPSDIHK